MMKNIATACDSPVTTFVQSVFYENGSNEELACAVLKTALLEKLNSPAGSKTLDERSSLADLTISMNSK